MKTALVCGAGGFIGGHLVKKLKREGYWVRGVDIKEHEFAPTQADEFLRLDLREPENCRQALTLNGGTFDEVYQLAADMGGMGFIHSAECEIMHNSALINIHMTHTAARDGGAALFLLLVGLRLPRHAARRAGNDRSAKRSPPTRITNTAGRSSTLSVWRMAYERNRGMTVRIARFQNCYGPAGHLDRRARKGPGGDLPQSRGSRGRRHDRGLGRRHGHPLVHLRGRYGRRYLLADAFGFGGRGQHRLPAVRVR